MISCAPSFRHLPMLNTVKVVHMISIRDVVKDIIRRSSRHNIDDLDGLVGGGQPWS